MRGQANRERILQAARQELAAHGYDGASLRGVARRARVDLRLVHHYFGRKNLLARAATQPGPGPGPGPAPRFTHRLLAAWDADPLGWRALMVSAMTHEPAGSRLIALLTRMLAEAATQPPPQAVAAAGQDHPGGLRRAAATSQLLGLAVLGEAGTLATADEPGGAAHSRLLARALDAYLDGDGNGSRDALPR